MRHACVITFALVAQAHGNDLDTNRVTNTLISVDQLIDKLTDKLVNRGFTSYAPQLNSTDLDNTRLLSVNTVSPLSTGLVRRALHVWHLHSTDLDNVRLFSLPTWSKGEWPPPSLIALFTAGFVFLCRDLKPALVLVSMVNEATQQLVAAMDPLTTDYLMMLTMAQMSPKTYEQMMTMFVYAKLAAALLPTLIPVIENFMYLQNPSSIVRDQPKNHTVPTGEYVCEGQGFDQAQCEDRKLCCVWDGNDCMSAIGDRPCWYYNTGEDVCEGHGLDEAECGARELCCIWDGDACVSGIKKRICWFYDVNGNPGIKPPPAGYSSAVHGPPPVTELFAQA